VDVEQANAISFLLAKSLMLERPIFCYIEFMVRAAEAFYSAGDPGRALLVAKQADKALRSYAHAHGHFPNFPRPFAGEDAVFSAITSNLVLSFVTGHEIGHLIDYTFGSQAELSLWVSENYKNNEMEPGRHFGGQTYRFLKPECIQKFDEKALPCGDIVQTIKFAKRWPYLKELQAGEARSDLFGLISFTEAAARSGVSAEIAATVLLQLLEFSEMLMAFRRLLPRLPQMGQRTSVAYEATNLGFRRFMTIQSIDAIRKNELPVSGAVRDYWQRLSNAKMDLFSSVNSTGELSSVSNRSVHLARAALTLNGLGYLPEAPTEAQIFERYGPLAGDGFFLASCLKIPENWMRISRHGNWRPNENDENVPIGYGSAIYDISKLVKRPNRSQSANSVFCRQNDLTEQTMVAVLRHPRTQAFARKIIGRWPHSVMKSV